MAYTVQSNTNTPVTILRDSLDKADRLVVQVDGKSVEEFLTLLDSIEEQFTTLEEADSDLRSEQNRWESLLSRVNTKPDPIVNAARAAGGMDKLRAAHPPADSFWWHLDGAVTKRRLLDVRRMLVTVVSVVAIAIAGYWAINFFFPPDPAAVLMVETTNSLDRLISTQHWQEALDLVKSVRGQLPDNSELMVWDGVLNERLSNSEEANAALSEAQSAFAARPVLYWVTLGNTRLRVGDIEGAQAAGDKAMAIDPNEPQAYFLLGSVAETAGDLQSAISYFDQTSQLAEESNPQLSVIARVRMGQLMQNPGSMAAPATTPTALP